MTKCQRSWKNKYFQNDYKNKHIYIQNTYLFKWFPDDPPVISVISSLMVGDSSLLKTLNRYFIYTTFLTFLMIKADKCKQNVNNTAATTTNYTNKKYCFH